MKYLVILMMPLCLIASCRKGCWKCDKILAGKSIYVRGTDTVILYTVEASWTNGHDTLLSAGYQIHSAGFEEIPVDYEMCYGESTGPYLSCHPVK